MAGPGVRIGEGQQGEGVALPPVGHEHLGAGDEVLVAVAPGHRAEGLHVRAGVGFGEAEPPAGLAAGEAGQQAPPLLLGAVLEHDQGGHGVAVDDPGQGHEPAAQLLDDAGVGGHVEAEAAVLRGHQGPEQPEPLHPLHHLARIAVVVLQRGREAAHVVVHELADRGQEVGRAARGCAHGGAVLG